MGTVAQSRPLASTASASGGSATLSAVQKAAQAVNENLQLDARYPAFDDYVSREFQA